MICTAPNHIELQGKLSSRDTLINKQLTTIIKLLQEQNELLREIHQETNINTYTTEYDNPTIKY